MSKQQETKVSVEPQRRLSDERALEILSDAAFTLGEFFGCARRAIQQVEPELLAKVLKEQPVETALDPEPARRPRGRAHPLMALFQMAIRASATMTRIVTWTNPGLLQGTDNNGRSIDASVRSAESMMAGLEKLVAGMNLPPA